MESHRSQCELLCLTEGAAAVGVVQVLASCSVDRTVRVWDCRTQPDKACMLTAHAHATDVNVISWNHSEPLLVSGGDDGCLKIWDLRQFSKYSRMCCGML